MVTDEQTPKTSKGIKPTVFKTLVSRGHPEFSTKRQQDAYEFFVNVLELIEKSVHIEGSPVNPADYFKVLFFYLKTSNLVDIKISVT